MVRLSTLYISLDMPPDLDTKPTEPGRYSLQDTMLSSVPAVSPTLNAPACAENDNSAIQLLSGHHLHFL